MNRARKDPKNLKLQKKHEKTFKSKDPVHAVSYNLVRSLMQEAAIRHQVDLTRFSFKGTVDTLRHWSASLEAMRGMPRKQQALLGAMFEIVAKDLVPLRPGREEPRAKKPPQELSSSDETTPRNENFRPQKPSQITLNLVPFITDPVPLTPFLSMRSRLGFFILSWQRRILVLQNN